MKIKMCRILYLLIAAVFLAGCSSGGNNDRKPPPPDTDLDWDQGNWNEQDWQ